MIGCGQPRFYPEEESSPSWKSDFARMDANRKTDKQGKGYSAECQVVSDDGHCKTSDRPTDVQAIVVAEFSCLALGLIVFVRLGHGPVIVRRSRQTRLCL